ncbi:MAG: hypothetical protein ABJC09_05355 [Terriglobia bacterium]
MRVPKRGHFRAAALRADEESPIDNADAASFSSPEFWNIPAKAVQPRRSAIRQKNERFLTPFRYSDFTACLYRMQ